MSNKITFYRKIFAVLILSVFLVSACEGRSHNSDNGQCMQTFDRFAFENPFFDWNTENTVYPSNPWEEITSIDIKGVNLLNLMVVVQDSNKAEIWLKNFSGDSVIIVYNSTNDKYEIIPAEIEHSGVYIKEVFIDSTNQVWGKNSWSSSERVMVEEVPALSKFNNETRQFEFVDDALELPITERTTTLGNDTSAPLLDFVTLGENDVFWIFHQKTGTLYSFNALNHDLEIEYDFGEDFIISQLLMVNDNTILLKRAVYEKVINDHDIIEYRIQDRIIEFIEFPSNAILVNAYLFIDDNGNLWNGASGWLDKDEIWHQLHPNLEEYIDDFHRILPTIVLEDSRGILWLELYTGSNNGLAWYSPEQGVGCQVSSFSGNVFEDASHNLWFVADNKIFKLQLGN